MIPGPSFIQWSLLDFTADLQLPTDLEFTGQFALAPPLLRLVPYVAPSSSGHDPVSSFWGPSCVTELEGWTLCSWTPLRFRSRMPLRFRSERLLRGAGKTEEAEAGFLQWCRGASSRPAPAAAAWGWLWGRPEPGSCRTPTSRLLRGGPEAKCPAYWPPDLTPRPLTWSLASIPFCLTRLEWLVFSCLEPRRTHHSGNVSRTCEA